MPDFLYRAKTVSGQDTEGSIMAGSQREALAILRRQSLFPLEVRDPADADAPFNLPFRLSPKVKAETVADTMTQFSDLLANGVPMLESLKILSEQSANKRMGEVLAEVHDAVENGSNLDEALAAHPKIFSALTVNMVRAGLEGAFLEYGKHAFFI